MQAKASSGGDLCWAATSVQVPRYEVYDEDGPLMDRDMTAQECAWLEEDARLAEVSLFARDQTYSEGRCKVS